MYTDGAQEISMTTGTTTVDLESTGDKARWGTLYTPFTVRAVAVVLNGIPGSAGIVTFDRRITFSSDTGRVNAAFGTVNLATTHAVGNVVYAEITPTVLNPGQEIVAECTDASAACTACKLMIYGDYTPDRPANFTAMVASV